MAHQAFISSTSKDLAEYRKAAIDICNELQIVPVAMEFFSAMGKGATAGSKRKVDESDLYVGIFAHRYGYVEEGYDRSVTEIEFDYAGERGLERLCFLVKPDYPWPPEMIDIKQYQALDRFKQKINTSLIRAEFTTVDDFRAKLISALVEWKKHKPETHTLPTHQASRTTHSVPAGTPLPVPALLIGRDEDLHRLRGRLGAERGMETRSLTVIRGWPGVGKTTLLLSLAYDPAVIAAFPDGILWASVGEDPQPLKDLKAWGRALGADLDQAQTIEDAMSSMRNVLREKRALLIVDDVWETDSALPFRVGGPACATLFTTRFAKVARELVTIPQDVYLLDGLTDEKGFDLLSQLAPSVTERYPQETVQLVRDLEGLPLALRVAGRMLEEERRSGFDVRETFRSLADEALLLKERAPEDRFDPRTGTTPTIELLLKKSTDRLDEEMRRYFACLGAFAPKPATFDVDAMKAVWQVDDARVIIHQLVDRGLLEPIPSLGRFWMHSILVKHAVLMLEQM